MACLYACCWFRFFSCGVVFFFRGICSSNRLGRKDRRSRISAVLSIGGIFVVVVVPGLNLVCAVDCGAVGVRLYGRVFAAFFVGLVSSVLTGGGVCAIGGIFVVVVVLIGWNLRTLLPLLSSSSCAVDLDAVCVGDVIGGICRIGLYACAVDRVLFLVFASFFVVSFFCSIVVFGLYVIVVRALLLSAWWWSSSSCAVDCSAVCVVDVIGDICRIGLYGLASWVFFVVFLCVISLSYG